MKILKMAQEIQLDNYFVALFYDNESEDILLEVTDTNSGTSKKIRLRTNDYLKLMASFISKDYKDLRANFRRMLSIPKDKLTVTH